MLKEFRNKYTLHSSRVFETTMAADMSRGVITGGVEKSWLLCQEREIHHRHIKNEDFN